MILAPELLLSQGLEGSEMHGSQLILGILLARNFAIQLLNIASLEMSHNGSIHKRKLSKHYTTVLLLFCFVFSYHLSGKLIRSSTFRESILFSLRVYAFLGNRLREVMKNMKKIPKLSFDVTT